MKSHINIAGFRVPTLLAVALFVVAAAAVVLGMGYLDPHSTITGALLAEGALAVDLKKLEEAMNKSWEKTQENLKKAQDVADKALDESKRLGGVIEAKTADTLKALDENRLKVQEEFLALRTQIIEVAQKAQTLPAGLSFDPGQTVLDMIVESPEWKQCAKLANPTEMAPITIGNWHKKFLTKTQIVNATGQNQPLVPDQRVPGLIVPAERRLYIRDLLPQATTASNLIQFASEATFTNNARPQGDASPGGIEGEAFAESAMTFSLANAPVVTLGHWIPASRQVLKDASMLEGHLSTRLIYGLKLEEESELLTGDGTAGKITGLNSSAAAFTGGATNQTILDTLLKAILQVSLSNYEASAFVMHPTDWYNAMMLKDTTNRYLFSDPQSMVAPRVWAKPVVASQTQTQGKFLAGAFNLGAQIWDNEDATVRISEHHASFFVQGMVAILAEERLALTVYRSTAFVYGNTSYAG